APVRVAMGGPGSGAYLGFLDRYLTLLRREAGIDIARGPGAANLHIRFVAGPDFTRRLPRISCVVAPGDLTWAEFRANPDRLGGRSLERAFRISAMTIFLPESAAPYLIRSCLIEEIAQALGPANDLYGLGPSIFNDDAAHIWPTALDLMVLKVLYQPEMRSGLGRRETERRAREILARLNPEGARAPALTLPSQRAMGAWRETHAEVFSRATSQNRAPDLARKALEIAAARAPESAYHCHAQRTLGRVLARTRPGEALAVLGEATRLCARVHGRSDIRLSLIALERAVALIRQGSYAAALATLNAHEARLAALGQEERLAALYGLKAQALGGAGLLSEADRARRQAHIWAAYAYGAQSSQATRFAKDGS
ncbi:MAG: DUF2927 domain-containing protein, partial [Pseudomonadota bacterium]